MANLRLNTEKKIDNDYFNLKIGTTNRINPKAIYIEGNAFISPIEETDDYANEISLIKHNLKRKITNTIFSNSVFDNKFILNFEVATNGIKHNKKSYASFQLVLRQKNELPLKLKDLKERSSDMIDGIVNELGENFYKNNFYTYKSKKQIAPNIYI